MTERGLQRALGFEHDLYRRCAVEVASHRWGEGFFNPELPKVWDLNFLLVRGAPELDASGLHEEALRLRDERGLPHIKLAVDDEALGARVAPGLRGLGWEVERDVIMEHRRAPDHEPPEEVAEEATLESLWPAWEGSARRSLPDPDLVAQVLEMNRVLRAPANTRFFAARRGADFVSWCELYARNGVAQVEQVATLEEHRGRGYARAVVSAAVRAARSAGSDFVWLRADDDDWPKKLYENLGFDPIGRTYAAVLREERG